MIGFKTTGRSAGATYYHQQVRTICLRQKQQDWLVESCHHSLQAGKHSLKLDNLAIAIPYQSVISKTLTIDNRLRKKEIKTLVTEHAQQCAGKTAQNLIIDFELSNSSTQTDQMEVCWVAAKRQEIEETVRIFNRFNWKVQAVEVDSFVLSRIGYFLLNCLNLKDTLAAILHIDDQSILFSWLKNRECLFMHSEKHQHNIAATLFRALQLCSTELISTTKIVLVSGEMTDLDLLNDIQKIIGVKTILANPFQYLNLNALENKAQQLLLHEGHAYTMACGLAMRPKT